MTNKKEELEDIVAELVKIQKEIVDVAGRVAKINVELQKES